MFRAKQHHGLGEVALVIHQIVGERLPIASAVQFFKPAHVQSLRVVCLKTTSCISRHR